MKFIIRLVMIAVFIFAPNIISAEPINNRALAKEFNNQGYELYKQGKYENALKMFEKSFTADDSFFLPHYNYACTLGVLMKRKYEEWWERKEEAISHLQKVVNLNPSYLTKIKTDPDLDKLRKCFSYYMVIGLSTKKSSDVKQILCGLSWYIEGLGIYQYIGGASFFTDNSFCLWYYPPKYYENAFDSSNLEYKGSYSINGNRITLKLNNKMLRKRNLSDINDNDSVLEESLFLECILTNDGVIKVNTFEYPLTSYCDEFSA